MWETEANLKRVEIERRAFEISAEAKRWFEKEIEEANPEPREYRNGLVKKAYEDMVLASATLGVFLVR